MKKSLPKATADMVPAGVNDWQRIHTGALGMNPARSASPTLGGMASFQFPEMGAPGQAAAVPAAQFTHVASDHGHGHGHGNGRSYQHPPAPVAKFPTGGAEMGQSHGLLGARQMPSSLPPMMDVGVYAENWSRVGSSRVQNIWDMAHARVAGGYLTPPGSPTSRSMLTGPTAASYAARSRVSAPDQLGPTGNMQGLDPQLLQSALQTIDPASTMAGAQPQPPSPPAESSPSTQKGQAGIFDHWDWDPDTELLTAQAIAKLEQVTAASAQQILEAVHEISEYGWLLGVDMAGDVAQWRAYAQGAALLPHGITMADMTRTVCAVACAQAKMAINRIMEKLVAEKKARVQGQVHLKRSAPDEGQLRQMRQRTDSEPRYSPPSLRVIPPLPRPLRPQPMSSRAHPQSSAREPPPGATYIDLTGSPTQTPQQMAPRVITPQQRLIQCAQEAMMYQQLLPHMDVDANIQDMLEFASRAVGQVDAETLEKVAAQAQECCAQLAAMLAGAQGAARPTPPALANTNTMHGYSTMGYPGMAPNGQTTGQQVSGPPLDVSHRATASVQARRGANGGGRQRHPPQPVANTAAAIADPVEQRMPTGKPAETIAPTHPAMQATSPMLNKQATTNQGCMATSAADVYSSAEMSPAEGIRPPKEFVLSPLDFNIPFTFGLPPLDGQGEGRGDSNFQTPASPPRAESQSPAPIPSIQQEVTVSPAAAASPLPADTIVSEQTTSTSAPSTPSIRPQRPAVPPVQRKDPLFMAKKKPARQPSTKPPVHVATTVKVPPRQVGGPETDGRRLAQANKMANAPTYKGLYGRDPQEFGEGEEGEGLRAKQLELAVMIEAVFMGLLEAKVPKEEILRRDGPHYPVLCYLATALVQTWVRA